MNRMNGLFALAHLIGTPLIVEALYLNFQEDGFDEGILWYNGAIYVESVPHEQQGSVNQTRYRG